MPAARNIFLIDDDEDDRWLFAEALARTVPQVKCESAASGQEAIQFLDASSVLPDCIFLDLNMPGMDGKNCLTQLKSHPKLKTIPVIVYSTSNYHKDIEETKALGADEFIIKPSDYTQLCQMFRTRFSS
jgi:CheY-like chemotaxis protein